MKALALQAPAPATRTVPIAKIGKPIKAAFAAFAPMTHVPRGHRAIEMSDDHPGMIRAGEFAIINPADRELTNDGVYLFQWREGGRVSVLVAQWADIFGKLAWWIRGPAGGIIDGPYTAERLAKVIVARVVGTLADDTGCHLTALWGAGAMEGRVQRVVGADDLPEKYVSVVEGTCMEPLYHTGNRLEFTQLERARPGDTIALWRRPEYHRPGLYQCLVKRLVTALPRKLLPSADDPARPAPVFIVETINPLKRFVVKADELIGVHKCNGHYTGPRWQPTEDEIRALAAEQRAARR